MLSVTPRPLKGLRRCHRAAGTRPGCDRWEPDTKISCFNERGDLFVWAAGRSVRHPYLLWEQHGLSWPANLFWQVLYGLRGPGKCPRCQLCQELRDSPVLQNTDGSPCRGLKRMGPNRAQQVFWGCFCEAAGTFSIRCGARSCSASAPLQLSWGQKQSKFCLWAQHFITQWSAGQNNFAWWDTKGTSTKGHRSPMSSSTRNCCF